MCLSSNFVDGEMNLKFMFPLFYDSFVEFNFWESFLNRVRGETNSLFLTVSTALQDFSKFGGLLALRLWLARPESAFQSAKELDHAGG